MMFSEGVIILFETYSWDDHEVVVDEAEGIEVVGMDMDIKEEKGCLISLRSIKTFLDDSEGYMIAILSPVFIT